MNGVLNPQFLTLNLYTMKPLIFSGRVVKGEGMASDLGCPTANIALDGGVIIPALGVYFGEAELEGYRYNSLICISDGRTGYNLKMEVHMFGLLKDVLGKTIQVKISQRVRDLVPYESEDQMSKIIAEDLRKAQEWFGDEINKNH